MKNGFSVLGAALFLSLSTNALASTDIKSIDIEVIKESFVQLTGSAVDGNTKILTLASVEATNPISLGTLGVSSNIAAGSQEEANCSVSFSAENNYSLLHTASGAQLRKFYVTFQNKNINNNNDQDKDITVNCNLNPQALTITPSGPMLAEANIAAGTYRDTLTITVTAP